MTRSRLQQLLVVCVAAFLIVGCGTTRKSTSTAGGPPLRGGGYYKDDGPGSNIPPGIEKIPDAVPRVEPHNPANFKPYVVLGQRFVPVSASTPLRQRGVASWYGRKFHGKKTANGETYDMYSMSAAHPTLPLPSYARVTHEDSGRSIIVRVNDRGPFLRGRVIDLSYAAAAKLGIIGQGSDVVTVEAITHADIRKGLNYASASPPKSAASNTRPASTVAATTQRTAAQPVKVASVAAPTSSPRVAAQAATPSGATSASSSPPSAAASASVASSAVVTPDALAVLSAPALASADAKPALDSADAAPALAAADTGVIPGVNVAASSAPPSAARTVIESGATPTPTVTEDQLDGIYLQFGAFASYISADRLANRLNGEIAQVEAGKVHVDSRADLHRVRIGPYPSRTAAVNAAVRIQDATGMRPALAQR